MLVHQLLESNKEMSLRLASIRIQSDTASSRSAAIRHGRYHNNDEASTIRPGRTGNGAVLDSELTQTVAFGFAFEQDLQGSRVYRRALVRDAESSDSSSFGRSVGWSFLSGLSLTDISCLSVISLPISRQEIWNSSYYEPDYQQSNHLPFQFKEVEDLPSGLQRLSGLPGVFVSEKITEKIVSTGPAPLSLAELRDALQRCKACHKVLSMPLLRCSATTPYIQSLLLTYYILDY